MCKSELTEFFFHRIHAQKLSEFSLQYSRNSILPVSYNLVLAIVDRARSLLVEVEQFHIAWRAMTLRYLRSTGQVAGCPLPVPRTPEGARLLLHLRHHSRTANLHTHESLSSERVFLLRGWTKKSPQKRCWDSPVR